MARINLLPWRAERRRQRQKEFLAMLAFSGVLALALSFVIISYYNGQIEGQSDRNAFLKTQITAVDAQIKEIEALDDKKSKLLARKEVIEQLQEGDKLTLQGRSQSNARVSNYMRNLESAGWMTKPELSIIEAKAGDAGLPYTFTLTVMLANPNAPKDLDGDGVPDAPVAPAAAAPAATATPAAVAPAQGGTAS